MVSNDDSFVGIGSVDDSNDVVYWLNRITRDGAESELHARGRTRAIIGIETACPSSAVYLLSGNTMAIESLQQRLSGRVRNWQSWNLGNNLRDVSSR
jgi:hypothetical protein